MDSPSFNLNNFVAKIPDFPKPGILFYDISPLLANADAWQVTVGRIARLIGPMLPDFLVGVESRGFTIAAPLAAQLGLGFALVRKQGKLPGETTTYRYDLEYGSDTLELRKGVIKPKSRVVILDDLLATGGTIAATIELLRKNDVYVAGAATIIELSKLNGREKVKQTMRDLPMKTLLTPDQ